MPDIPFFLVVPVARSYHVNDKFGVPREYIYNGVKRTFKHEGLDLAATDAQGNPVSVLAAQAGTVMKVGVNRDKTTGQLVGYGNYIVIEHPWNGEKWVTWYGHLSEFRTVEGKFVQAGEVIGVAGTTGNSSGIHLHLTVQHIGFGISSNDFTLPDVVDPEPLIKQGNISIPDLLTFVADVNFANGAIVAPGTAFTKRWKVRNGGTSAWEMGYMLTFRENDRLSALNSVALPAAASGDTAEVAVDFTAPTVPGQYKSVWEPRNAQGQAFASSLDVEIEVKLVLLKDEMRFVSDVTIEDGTLLTAGQTFDKVWRVRNSGGTSWGAGYTLAFLDGKQMNGPDSIALPPAAPGEVVNLPPLPLKAPTLPGRYKSQWRPRNAQGNSFDFTLFVDIRVGQGETLARLDEVRYETDVTIPDNTVLKPGQAFRKTWRVRNTGSTTWNAAYQWAFFGDEQMGGPDSFNVQRPVLPGQTGEFWVDLIAPQQPGTHRSTWKMKNDKGQFFEFDIYTLIEVRS